MSQIIIQKEIVDELKTIHQDLDYIKKHMVDIDMLLTSKEEANLEESLKEYHKGKATSLEDFEKEMGK